MTKASYLAVALCSFCPALPGQSTSTFGSIVEGRLTVGLLDRSPQILERSDIAKLHHKKVRVKESGSKRSIYSGVPLKELLESLGGFVRTDLGGIVVFESVDGPPVLF